MSYVIEPPGGPAIWSGVMSEFSLGLQDALRGREEDVNRGCFWAVRQLQKTALENNGPARTRQERSWMRNSVARAIGTEDTQKVDDTLRGFYSLLEHAETHGFFNRCLLQRHRRNYVLMRRVYTAMAKEAAAAQQTQFSYSPLDDD